MIVSREATGISAHCFKCDMDGWQAEQENPADKLALFHLCLRCRCRRWGRYQVPKDTINIHRYRC